VTITVSQKVEKRKKKSRNKWIKRENLEGKNKAKKSKSRDLTLKASCALSFLLPPLQSLLNFL
jgi:hypothetical protein